MKKGTKNIVSAVRETIAPIVAALGYALWDVEYVKEGSQYYLRITIDQFEGINIEDCEKVHRAIDAPLDELDPTDGQYMLEVSSPGIERELKYPEHFRAFLGEQVELHAFAPLEEADGQKAVVGILESYDKEYIGIGANEHHYKIPNAKTANVKTVYDYNINAEEDNNE